MRVRLADGWTYESLIGLDGGTLAFAAAPEPSTLPVAVFCGVIGALGHDAPSQAG
jgi:hypothetical protein